METSTVNQLIETIGIFITVIVVMYFYFKVTKWRSAISKEILLLKDCYFYRRIIEKYKDLASENEDGNYYNRFRKEVEEETGITSSRYSQPKDISNRLEELKKTDKQLEEFLSKIKLN